jgi:hypothetical protein
MSLDATEKPSVSPVAMVPIGKSIASMGMEAVKMNRFSRVLCFGSVLVFGMAARGQGSGQGPYYRGGYNDDGYSRGRGDDRRQYGNDRFGYGRNQGSLIGRIMSDLDRAASNSRLDGHERKHFDEAAAKLQDFEGRWSQGRFDTGKLDGAIENLKHLANAVRVNRRDRQILARDVEELRQFRASRGRFSNDGYEGYRDDRYNRDPR